jgi:hypothetical protein
VLGDFQLAWYSRLSVAFYAGELTRGGAGGHGYRQTIARRRGDERAISRVGDAGECPAHVRAAIARWVEGLLLDQYQRNFGSPLAITLPVGRDMAALHEEFLGLRLVVSGVRRDRLAPADVAEPSSEMPPSAMPTLRLPLSDESSVAQSMQFFLLATELLNHLAERG